MSAAVVAQFALLAIVAVLLLVGAYRLDEQRNHRNRGLWRLVHDSFAGLGRRRDGTGGLDALSSAGERDRLPRALGLLLVLVVVGGIATVSWWARDARSADPSAAPATGGPQPALADDTDGTPALSGTDLTGATPVEVAVALSRQRYPEGADDVLLVADAPASDAVVAAGLAGAVDGPVLVTAGDVLSPETAAEIERLGTPDVHVIGLQEAISTEVEAELVAAGHRTHRDAGATGIETAIAAAQRHASRAQTVVLVRTVATVAGSGDALVPALAGGALAAARDLPLLVTAPDGLSDPVGTYLTSAGVTSAVVVGGADQVSEQVRADLAALGVTVTRIAGGDAADIAAAVADADGWPTPGAVVLAASAADEPWPTAFAASLLAGRHVAPVLLADGEVLPDATRDALERRPAGTDVLCAPGVVSAACEAARQIVGGV